MQTWYIVFKIVCIVVAVLSALGIVWLLLISPQKKRRAQSAELMKWDYAHRGLHDAAIPENSLAAFRAAVEHGYGMELDVQITLDGKLVVHHDHNIKRMCGVDRNIYECTYDELRSYRLLDSDERIPLFTEVLECVQGKTPMIIEVKTHKLGALKACELLTEQLSGYEGLYCMESFNPFAVEWFKKHAPQIIRGQLSCKGKGKSLKESLQYWVLANLLLNFRARPDFIAYCFAHRKYPGYRLCTSLTDVVRVAWTIRTQEDYDVARKSFDMIIFENFIPNDEKSPSQHG